LTAPSDHPGKASPGTAHWIRLAGDSSTFLDDHRLFSTTPAFLKYLGLRDLADLPPLPELEQDRSASGG
jgi:chromosome segregation and condensation protein ScpB